MSAATDMPRLIGTKRWNPIGESMLTVLEKIALLNHLTPRELAKMVGAYGAMTFTAVERSDPGDPATVRLDELRQVAGWSPRALDASFPAFYRPPESDMSVPDPVFFDFHPAMRICPTCAAEGQHLLLHQSRAFARCPVHGEPMTIDCPACSSQLGRYAYPPNPLHSARCSHCSWSAFSASSDIDMNLQNKRIRVVDDFATWMTEIKHAATGAHATVRLLDRPRRFADIARLDALVPGPSWLAGCLEAAPRVRTVHRELKLRDEDVSAALSPSGAGASAVLGERKRPAIASWNDRIDRTAMDLVAGLRRSLPSTYNPHGRLPGVRRANFGYTLHHSEFSSVAALGFLWWEDCLTSAIPALRDERRSFRKATRETQLARIWNTWSDGPGRMFATGTPRRSPASGSTAR